MTTDYSNLPASATALVNNFKAAMATTGTPGGGDGFAFMRIDHQTGAMTFGKDGAPVPLGHRWAVPIASIEHGFKIWSGGKVTEEVMVPMAQQPAAPTPGEPFVGFGADGPRRVTQLNLHSLEEQGLALTFSSMGVSHDNRIRSLLGDIVDQIAAHGPKYPNPVIRLKPGNYTWQGKSIFHFDYELTDWISNDGVSLQSAAPAEDAEPASPDDLPWDVEGPAGPGEKL